MSREELVSDKSVSRLSASAPPLTLQLLFQGRDGIKRQPNDVLFLSCSIERGGGWRVEGRPFTLRGYWGVGEKFEGKTRHEKSSEAVKSLNPQILKLEAPKNPSTYINPYTPTLTP